MNKAQKLLELIGEAKELTVLFDSSKELTKFNNELMKLYPGMIVHGGRDTDLSGPQFFLKINTSKIDMKKVTALIKRHKAFAHALR